MDIWGLREELRALGASDEQYRAMTVENPRRALTGEA
jgi:predicted metal-dependent phosphotriesterase family hydrolase